MALRSVPRTRAEGYCCAGMASEDVSRGRLLTHPFPSPRFRYLEEM
jgi:hypothetical protein